MGGGAPRIYDGESDLWTQGHGDSSEKAGEVSLGLLKYLPTGDTVIRQIGKSRARYSRYNLTGGPEYQGISAHRDFLYKF